MQLVLPDEEDGAERGARLTLSSGEDERGTTRRRDPPPMQADGSYPTPPCHRGLNRVLGVQLVPPDEEDGAERGARPTLSSGEDAEIRPGPEGMSGRAWRSLLRWRRGKPGGLKMSVMPRTASLQWSFRGDPLRKYVSLESARSLLAWLGTADPSGLPSFLLTTYQVLRNRGPPGQVRPSSPLGEKHLDSDIESTATP